LGICGNKKRPEVISRKKKIIDTYPGIVESGYPLYRGEDKRGGLLFVHR
jgi:hypothetical protein